MASYVEHNDTGTASGLRVLYEQRFTGRLVLASSMVVYGEGRYDCAAHGAVRPGPRRAEDLEEGRFDPSCPQCGSTLEARPVGEDAPLDPRNVYAATKLHQEHLCEVFGRETGASVAALRYHNVYGRGMPRDTPYAGVAAIFASAVASGRAPQVFEDGRQRRDFVHVRDVARATVMAAVAPPDVVGPLNIATGQPRTVGDLAAALWHAGGSQGPVPQVTGDFRLGDVRHVFASPERASDLLGFRAEIPFEEGLADLFADR
jgi:dTDP-L-rhamnose 4-epimerase